MLKYLTFKREFVFGGVVAVALIAGGIGFYLGERKGEAKSNQGGIVNLSSSEVEAEKPRSTPPMQPSIPAQDGSPSLKPSDSYVITEPAKAAVEDNLASTGMRIVPDQHSTGKGKIQAINGTPLDASVSILDANTQQRIRSVYIKADNSFSFDRIEPGSYRIIYTTGVGWDHSAKQFNLGASYFEFGQVLSFREQSGVVDRYTITLHEVPNGNVHARQLSESEFRSLNTSN